MNGARSTSVRCCAVVVLFMLSTLMLGYSPENREHMDSSFEPLSAPTPFGQTKLLSIGSFPDGANANTRLSVDEGAALKTLDLQIDSARLPSSTGFSLTESSDFSTNTVYDGMDVNGSSLTILPQGWEWDFENANHGWTLGSPAWKWGFDSVIGQAGGVASGVKALYTYDGNYPNNMGSTLWATSPVMDCSACSGAWELSFMRRLGVESPSWDHAYISVKTSSGSWASLYSNPSSVSDGSFNQQTISLNNYIAGNSNLQIRFGIGTTDSSVTYTGWNIDDVSIMPSTTGTSSGEGNWTSAPLSPTMFGQGEERAFGYLHLDAFVPQGEIFEWRLLDATTSQPVPGFENSILRSIDLGLVDWETYPSIRLSIHMKSQAGGVPAVHGIHFEGKIFEDFSDDPTDLGWQLQGVSWANGVVSGTGTLKTSTFNVRSGFAGFDSNSVLSSGAVVEYTLDGGSNWNTLVDGKQWLTTPAFSVQFRVSSSGSSWDIDSFDVELIRTSVPDGLRIDVGMDGISDWSLEGDGIGRLGIQDRLKDHSLWNSQPSAPSSPASYSLLLPAAGVQAFEFGVAAPLQAMNSPFLAMSIDGQDFMSTSLPNLQELQIIQLSSSELSTLNSALSQASHDSSVEGLPMVEVDVRIGSSTSTSDVLFGGIFAPYDASLVLQFGPSDPVIVALNSALQSVIPVSGSKELPLPIRMSSSGAVYVNVVQQTSQGSIEPISISVSNVSDTFTPSTDWVEVTSVFDFSNLGVTSPESYVKSNGWSLALFLTAENEHSETRCPMVSLPITGVSVNSCVREGNSMVWSQDGGFGEIRMLESGSFLQIVHRFQFPEQWEDEASLSVSVNMLAPSGPMLPVSMNFGLGSSQGVENDVEVKDWAIVYDNSVRSVHELPYLNPGEQVMVEVQLGFEDVPVSSSPRPGSTLVRFLADGVEVQSTSVLADGVASIPWTVPTQKDTVELEVEVIPLAGQNIVFAVPNTVSFGFDTVDPELLGMSVSEFDHVEASPLTSLEFTIGDRPTLPTHAHAMLWRSWSDDANGDGFAQPDEVLSQPLHLPNDLASIQGIYTLELDTSEAFSGSYFMGWLDVADSAGNIMLNSGSMTTPLFNIQVNNDGSPQLGTSPASWGHGDSVWLHPGEANVLHLPLLDLNGITDIAHIELDLAGNQNDPVVLKWDSENEQCMSLNMFLDIESCEFIPSDEGTLFSSEGIFTVAFSIEWGFDPDVSLLRIPKVMVSDYQGQSNRVSVPDLGWRFSGEIEVMPQSLDFSLLGTEVETLGTWVQPRADIDVAGELTWHQSNRAIIQPTDLKIELGESEVLVESVNGSFEGVLSAPLNPGSYGISTSLHNPPNGAIDRTASTAPAWFIVDNQAPTIVGIPSPVNDIVLFEQTWSDLVFEVLVSEQDRLNDSSLTLHWAVHPEGVGLSSQSVINGSEQLSIIGGRAFGNAIPCTTTLDLDTLLTSSMRNDALEVRIWVTGKDMAGHDISSVFNDIDAPLAVWVLEQRIAEYSFTTPEMKPNKEISVGQTVDIGVSITNSGLADGQAQIFVELVESNGARTRIDARSLNIEAGGTYVYSKEWTPSREGTMWLEFQIINGPNVQTNTVYVDEAASNGVFASVSAVNPILLVIIFLLTVSLVGLMMFGLKTPQQQWDPSQQPRKRVPRTPANPTTRKLTQSEQQPVSGPYGAAEVPAAPGENPYS